jgi:HAD domain in Swiss Army Knife RNA repair proteins
VSLFLFVDMDGVLRRLAAPKYKLEADLVVRFSAWVRELEAKYGTVELVVSSSWKDAFPLDEIRGHFPPELQRKLIGTTPTLNPPRDHQRYHEIRAWLRANDTNGSEWLAVDDQADLFLPGLSNLILVDPEVGFNL